MCIVWLLIVGFQKDVSQLKLEMYVDVCIIYVNHVFYTMQFCKDLQRLRSGPLLELTFVDLLMVKMLLCLTSVVSNIFQY